MNDISKIVLLLQNMSNLRHLDIHIFSDIIDGNQLKYIITSDLPKLKTFHLKIERAVDSVENIEKQIIN
jgi:hypothetical protein